jgi:16S rRNA (guanine1516-N2)-methyltransferase
MTTAPVVVVAAADDATRSKNIAAQLALPLLSGSDELPEACVAYLSYCDNRLQLFPADPKQSGPIGVDFASDAAAYRLQSGGELIVKAIKGRSKYSLRVIDATAGLGRDSFVLAASGFEVTAIERDPIIAALLQDGLLRAQQTAAATIGARVYLAHCDALDYFANMTHEQSPDVIYLDPMFAHREKSALVKKEMRLFRQLLENEICDESRLLTNARAKAKLRVVVKRALKAPHFADIEPAYTLAGKAIRFDVYPS